AHGGGGDRAEDRRDRYRVRAAGGCASGARHGRRPGRGAGRVRGAAAGAVGHHADQAAPRLQDSGPDRAAVPVIRGGRRRVVPVGTAATVAADGGVPPTGGRDSTVPGRTGTTAVRPGGVDRAAADQLAAGGGAALPRLAAPRG